MRPLLLLLAAMILSSAAFAQATAIGQCDGCKPNEASAYVEYEIGPGEYARINDPGCDENTDSAIHQRVQAYAELQVPGVAQFAGPVIKDVGTQIGRTLRANIGGSLGDLIQTFSPATANCAAMAVAMPKSAKYTGYRY